MLIFNNIHFKKHYQTEVTYRRYLPYGICAFSGVSRLTAQAECYSACVSSFTVFNFVNANRLLPRLSLPLSSVAKF